MPNTVTPPPAKGPPLVTLDLEDNGGRLAPTKVAELCRWIQTEHDFRLWIQQIGYGDHFNTQREAIGRLDEALDFAH